MKWAIEDTSGASVGCEIVFSRASATNQSWFEVMRKDLRVAHLFVVGMRDEKGDLGHLVFSH